MYSVSPFDSNDSLIQGSSLPLNENKTKKRADKWDPKPLSENAAPQEALNCVSIRDPLRTCLTEAKKQSWENKIPFELPASMFYKLQVPLFKIQAYEDLIRHHVTLRITLFFQQAVACYKTPFHFEISKTKGQFFKAPRLRMTTQSKTHFIRFEAAHSSTIPSLKACLRDEYTEFEKDAFKLPRYFSFLKASHLENLDNSTVGLPDSVNKIDTLIDGKANGPGLRKLVIDLLNEVAQAKIDPIQATRQFIHLFDEQLRLRPASSKSMSVEKWNIVALYQDQLAQVQILAEIPLNMEGQHPFFDSLLNVNMTKENKNDVLTIRSIVYERKFEIIRESLLSESKVQHIIEKITTDISPKKKHFTKLTLVYFVRKNEQMRKTLEKIFCVSVDVIQNDQALCKKLKAYYQMNKIAFDHSLHKIRKVLHHFKKLENSFQALLLKEFRTILRNLNQSDLAHLAQEEIRKRIRTEQEKPQPNLEKIASLSSLPMSQSTISRLENCRIHVNADFKTSTSQRRKVFTLYQAEVIAKVLNVQVDHFFCSLFASEE